MLCREPAHETAAVERRRGEKTGDEQVHAVANIRVDGLYANVVELPDVGSQVVDVPVLPAVFSEEEVGAHVIEHGEHDAALGGGVAQ